MTQETLEKLQAFVLPWAKENHLDWYDLTLKVVSKPDSFRAYLIRLLECRWKEDVEARPGAPLLALEESAVTLQLKDGDQVLEFSGSKVKGRKRAIAELLMDKNEWQKLEAARQTFDLEYVNE